MVKRKSGRQSGREKETVCCIVEIAAWVGGSRRKFNAVFSIFYVEFCDARRRQRRRLRRRLRQRQRQQYKMTATTFATAVVVVVGAFVVLAVVVAFSCLLLLLLSPALSFWWPMAQNCILAMYKHTRNHTQHIHREKCPM